MMTIRQLAVLAALVFPATAAAFSADVYAVCRLDPNGDNFLALRAAPSTGAPMLLKLGPGTRLDDNEDLGRVGKWIHVNVEIPGYPDGWVWSDYICLIEDH